MRVGSCRNADLIAAGLLPFRPKSAEFEAERIVEVPAEQLEPLALRILEVDGDPLPEAEERELLKDLKV